MASSVQATMLHHSGLPVTDLERAIGWYRDGLGLEHTTTARVPEGVEIAFVVDRTGAGVELFALDWRRRGGWDGPIAALAGATGHVAFGVETSMGLRAGRRRGRPPVWEPRPRRSPGSASRSSRTRTGTSSS